MQFEGGLRGVCWYGMAPFVLARRSPVILSSVPSALKSWRICSGSGRSSCPSRNRSGLNVRLPRKHQEVNNRGARPVQTVSAVFSGKSSVLNKVRKLHGRRLCSGTVGGRESVLEMRGGFEKREVHLCPGHGLASPMTGPSQRQRRQNATAQFVVRGSSASVSAASEAGQVEHSQILESFFDDTGEFFEAKHDPPEWIKKVVAAGLVVKGSSALVGPGSVSLVPLLRSLGVDTVVAHWSLLELASIKASDDKIRCWHGNVEKLPRSWGAYDAVFLGHSPAMAFSASTLFESVICRCRTGARVVINQSQGNDFLAPYREMYPHILLRDLPELEELQSMINGLPLEFVSFQSDSSAYLVALEVNESLSKTEKEINFEDIGDFPLYASAKVVYGFGRGSKQMGIPTANLNPEELPKEIRDLPNGVYFGWAQVRGDGLDGGVHKMVMNIGNRPTFADSDAITVEVHVLHDYEIDFYGKDAAIVVLGFVRPEMKFGSLDALVARIGEDIKIARSSLEEEVLKSYQTDRFFRM